MGGLVVHLRSLIGDLSGLVGHLWDLVGDLGILGFTGGTETGGDLKYKLTQLLYFDQYLCLTGDKGDSLENFHLVVFELVLVGQFEF